MSDAPRQLIDRYFDDELTPAEFAEFEEWLRASPDNAAMFASAAIFHDQLTTAMKARSALAAEEASTNSMSRVDDAESFPDAASDQDFRPTTRGAAFRRRAMVVAATSLAASLLVVLLFWRGVNENPAAAATAELDRLIAAAMDAKGRVYRLDVEEIHPAPARSDRKKSPEQNRPPKPPLDGATLSVDGANRFVLSHRLSDGQMLITGADGVTSWAVRPEGPVKVSSDPTHFQRDVPGHEHAMSLNHLDQALEQLRRAYEIQVLPTEDGEEVDEQHSEPIRLLVAIRRRGERGPRRVEISYGATSRELRQLRFVDMPYGPDRLTLRLTFVESKTFSDSYFRHESHHDGNRQVVGEP